MSMPQEQLFETVLSLPQSQRADLAFQLLQSLDPTGVEVSSAEFGAKLCDRIEQYRRGDIQSLSLEEFRETMTQRLREGNAP